MATATRSGGTWNLNPPEPVGAASDLIPRLAARARGGGIMIGFDFPIGLPEAYGATTGLEDFPEALRAFGTGDWAGWYDVCESAEQVSLHRPFYPMRPGGTSRSHLLHGLGLSAADLLRLCERATPDRQAACMLFWTLGGNQVGKAAIAGWREVLAPNLPAIGLWPFDGSLDRLDGTRDIIIAETYPGEAYGHIGISKRLMGSKRKQEGRRRAGTLILDWFDARGVDGRRLQNLVVDGFTSRSSGEDQFDALVGLLGMLEVLDGRRSEGAPSTQAIASWEGWILGQQPSRAHLPLGSGLYP
jgi:hypothetical protein